MIPDQQASDDENPTEHGQDHDGATRPLRSTVLLLPPGRSGSRDPPAGLIERHISFGFVRERLKQSYSETGRPSIDPELLLRMMHWMRCHMRSRRKR
jgi:hypothetical protein